MKKRRDDVQSKIESVPFKFSYRFLDECVDWCGFPC